MGRDMTMGVIAMLVSVMGTDQEPFMMDGSPDPNMDSSSSSTSTTSSTSSGIPHDSTNTPFNLGFLPKHISLVSKYPSINALVEVIDIVPKSHYYYYYYYY